MVKRKEQSVPESMASLLRAQPLFSELQSHADTLSGCSVNVAFDAGELLLEEGAQATDLYLLRRGSVAIEVHTPGRGRLIVRTLGPGEIVGWPWLSSPSRWRFDARAVTQVGAVAIDGACLRRKTDAEPALGYALLRRISSMLVDELQSAQAQLLDLYGRGDRD